MSKNEQAIRPVKTLDREQAWQQVLARDRNADFVYAVASTGIFCRPWCPSRRPSAAQVDFFLRAADALAAGYRACKRCAPLDTHPETALALRLCRHLEARGDQTVTLAELATLTGKSRFTLQRIFQRVVGISPHRYHAELRTNRLRRSLSSTASSRSDGFLPPSVTDAIYDAGYSSSSRFYEQGTAALGMSPSRFREGGKGETIGYTTAPCILGVVLVAATDRGICSVMLGEEIRTLEQQLRAQFPQASISIDTQGLAEHVQGILSMLSHHPASRDLPLDLRGTVFQAQVWNALRNIPRGETRSYAQVARELGRPSAVRAVARACASNPVAIAVPCHRVIGSDGSLTGYRWSVERKRKLLAIESGESDCSGEDKR